MKIRRLITIILFTGFALLNTTCQKDSPSPQKKVIIAPEVRVISNQVWNENIISVDSTNFTVTFSKDITLKQKINAGDIIVSAVGEGFLRRVKSIETVNNGLKIKTESASLTDCIKQGSIDISQPVSILKVKKINYHYAGIKLNTNKLKSGGQELINLDINTVIYDADDNLSTTGDQIKLIGSLNCDWQYNLLIDVGLFDGLKEVKFGVSGSENLDLQLIAGLQYKFKKEISLATIYFVPFVFNVGIIPVVVSPQLEIIVGIDGSANASITSKITQSLSFDSGIRYLKNQGWAPYNTFEKDFSFQPPQLNLNASASAYLIPEFSTKVYYVAGPFVNLKIYSRLDADLLQTPWWKLYGGISMNAGANVDILDKYTLDFTVSDLIQYEQLIAQSPILKLSTPTVTTNYVTTFNTTSATFSGNIIDDGGAKVTENGVYYGTSPNPEKSGKKITISNGIGTFSKSITDLTSNTRYYIKAYAINSEGVAYGNQVTFTTSQYITKPVVTTKAITNVTSSSATSGGNMANNGGSTLTKRGVCWNTSRSPTIANSKTTDGSAIGDFISNLTGLKANTTYYVRAYATNSVGTDYGSEISFTTSSVQGLPVLTTTGITAITKTTAISGGNITSDGGTTITARGVCWSTTTNPIVTNDHTTDGASTGNFISNLTGLKANTKYYVRAYATNSKGTSYGSEKSFTTSSDQVSLPILTTTSVTSITQTSAISGGNITSNGGAPVTARGICWSTSQNPTIANSKTTDGSDIGTFKSNLTGLSTNKTYYVRAYATNSKGTAYGSQQTFTTLNSGGNATITDIDGNVYHTVTIGTQVWMLENLKTTKYRNGDPITNVTDGTVWNTLTTEALCNYDNNASNSITYGKLYNWYAVTDSRKLAPTGWHVPSDAEWNVLRIYIGDISIPGQADTCAVGYKLKETGTVHWASPNLGATNETGFTGLPGGYRYTGGSFGNIGFVGYWWSTTDYTQNAAWLLDLFYNNKIEGRDGLYKQYGLSVRCIKD